MVWIHSVFLILSHPHPWGNSLGHGFKLLSVIRIEECFHYHDCISNLYKTYSLKQWQLFFMILWVGNLTCSLAGTTWDYWWGYSHPVAWMGGAGQNSPTHMTGNHHCLLSGVPQFPSLWSLIALQYGTCYSHSVI